MESVSTMKTMTLAVLLPMLLLAACAPLPASRPAPSSTAAYTVTAAPLPGPTDTPVETLPPTFPVTEPPVNVPTVETPLTPQPGLIIRGYVRLADGSGLAGINICRNYASYDGVAVATTDANGYFESAFAFIPGDEMVGVWPVAAGYSFQPEYERWRHYYGSEDRSVEFIASPASGSATPMPACQ